MEEIKNILIANNVSLNAIISQENSKYGQNIKINILKIYENAIKNITQSKEKNIIVIYNGNPQITLFFSIKALLENKNIVLVSEEEYFNDTNNFILKLINQLNNGNFFIKKYYTKDLSKISNDTTAYDKMIYIGEKYKFKKLQEKCKDKIQYNGYNNIFMYYDANSTYYETMLNISKYCYDNNIIIEAFDSENILEDIYLMNIMAENYLCIILTEDERKQQEFRDRVKTKHLVINKNPFEEQEYIFECDL